MLQKTLLTLLCLAIFPAITLGEEKTKEWAKSFSPDPEVQAELRRWSRKEWPEYIKSQKDKMTGEEILDLLYLTLQRKAGGPEKFYLNAFYFTENAHNMEAAMQGINVVTHFPIRIRYGVPLRYLDSKDQDLRQLALRTVWACEYADKYTDNKVEPGLPKETDYSKYEKLFQEERQAIPAGLERLVKRMYRKDADQALLCFSRVYMRPKEAKRVDELFKKYQKEKASFQLLYELMAPENQWSGKWFIQLYVASKILQEKTAVDPTIKKILEKTPHQVVWEFMNEKVKEEL